MKEIGFTDESRLGAAVRHLGGLRLREVWLRRAIWAWSVCVALWVYLLEEWSTGKAHADAIRIASPAIAITGAVLVLRYVQLRRSAAVRQAIVEMLRRDRGDDLAQAAPAGSTGSGSVWS